MPRGRSRCASGADARAPPRARPASWRSFARTDSRSSPFFFERGPEFVLTALLGGTTGLGPSGSVGAHTAAHGALSRTRHADARSSPSTRGICLPCSRRCAATPLRARGSPRHPRETGVIEAVPSPDISAARLTLATASPHPSQDKENSAGSASAFDAKVGDVNLSYHERVRPRDRRPRRVPRRRAPEPFVPSRRFRDRPSPTARPVA